MRCEEIYKQCGSIPKWHPTTASESLLHHLSSLSSVIKHGNIYFCNVSVATTETAYKGKKTSHTVKSFSWYFQLLIYWSTRKISIYAKGLKQPWQSSGKKEGTKDRMLRGHSVHQVQEVCMIMASSLPRTRDLGWVLQHQWLWPGEAGDNLVCQSHGAETQWQIPFHTLFFPCHLGDRKLWSQVCISLRG